MSIKVNHDTCIGCQTCATMCPDTFAMNDNGQADPISQEVTDCAKSAEEACPAQAISIS